MAGNRPPLVSSLSVSFKRATTLTDDVAEAKREHRSNLKVLIDKYMEDVSNGKVEGIRNAKEMVEVIKADLLLLGEATERKDETAHEQRITKLTQTIDPTDPAIKKLMDDMLLTLNGFNDEDDISPADDEDEDTADVGGVQDGSTGSDEV